ncbi:BnaCnng32560D [Brassica napus]|uniref:BnaCnng32560D protein n=1 Tax=Brassica napus TaxID=3708 RepID=A0A078J2S6_BRANA|nr:BnaCnng32560D [Brassica napus]
MEKTGVRFVNMFKNNDVFPGFVVWINQTIQEPLKNVKEHSLVKTLETEIETTHDQNRDEEKLEKQLQAWRNNPSWIDQPPKVQSFGSIRNYSTTEGPARLVVAGKRRRWKQSGSMLRKMGVFPGFGSWISKNSQQPLKAKSKGSENVESKLVKEHYDEKEERIQHILWHEEEKKHPWKNPPPKVKVTTKKGVYHMNLEMTIGAAPELTYLWLIDSWGSHFYDEKKRRDLMVLTEDGPRRVIKVEKAVVYDFFSLTSIPIPLHLIVEENEKDLTGKYKKEKVMLMKVFEGNYKLEPVYVDQERLCKKRLPKSQEEYKKCSGGQGKIATKLIINQYFEPYPPFNLPPLSWYIRGNTIKTSKNLLNALQDTAKIIRSTKG